MISHSRERLEAQASLIPKTSKREYGETCTWSRVFAQVEDGPSRGCTRKEKNGSSGRTRTYNPPVNSCTNGKTANYRQLPPGHENMTLTPFSGAAECGQFRGRLPQKVPKAFSLRPAVLKTEMQTRRHAAWSTGANSSLRQDRVGIRRKLPTPIASTIGA